MKIFRATYLTTFFFRINTTVYKIVSEDQMEPIILKRSRVHVKCTRISVLWNTVQKCLLHKDHFIDRSSAEHGREEDSGANRLFLRRLVEALGTF